MSYVESAMRDARVKLDDRGLMAIGAAREIVRGTDVYEKGEGRMIDGTHVLDSDVVWAALLSLEDGAEFVHEARRIVWKFSVRGFDNIAPVQRYGATVLPWIEHNIKADKLAEQPWCLLPCLLAIDDESAFDVAAKIEGALPRWVFRHFDVGIERLADEPDHVEVLEAIAAVDAGAVRRVVGDAMADDLQLPRDNLDDEARAIVDAAEARHVAAGPPLLIGCMDAVCDEYLFPIWDNMNYFVAAMRCLAFAHPEGDAVVFQALTCGKGGDGICEELHAFGPPFGADQWGGLGARRVLCAHDLLFEWEDFDTPRIYKSTGVVIQPDGRIDVPEGGPAETFSFPLDGRDVSVPLKPTDEVRQTCGPIGGIMIALRDQLDNVLLDAAAVARRLALPADAELLFRFDAWRHPNAGEHASACRDVVTIVEALRRRRAIASLPEVVAPDFHLFDRLRDIGGWGDKEGWG